MKMHLDVWPNIRDLANLAPGFFGDESADDAADAVKQSLVQYFLDRTINETISELPRAVVEYRDIDIRKRFVLSLIRSAHHDFHERSSTHLYFAYYSDALAVRSFHPFKDKAFGGYVKLSSRIAMCSDDDELHAWLEFLDNRIPQTETVVPLRRERAPCSGAVNFKVNPVVDRKLDFHAERLSLSLNRLSELVFKQMIANIKDDIKAKGDEEIALNVRTFYSRDVSAAWKQRSVRIRHDTHARLLALARQLDVSSSAIATYLFSLYLATAS